MRCAGCLQLPQKGKGKKTVFAISHLRYRIQLTLPPGAPSAGSGASWRKRRPGPSVWGFREPLHLLGRTGPPHGPLWPPRRRTCHEPSRRPPSRKRWSLPPLGGRAPPGGALHFLPKRPSCLCVPLALAPAPPGRESSRQGPPRRLRSCGFCHAPPEEGGSSEKGWDSVCPPQGPARGGSGDSGGGGDPSGAAGGTSRGL